MKSLPKCGKCLNMLQKRQPDGSLIWVCYHTQHYVNWTDSCPNYIDRLEAYNDKSSTVSSKRPL